MTGANVLVGEVRGPGGEVMEERFVVLRDQVLEGIAWMRCPDCLGDPRGFVLPDDRRIPCVRCRGRLTVPVMA